MGVQARVKMKREIMNAFNVCLFSTELDLNTIILLLFFNYKEREREREKKRREKERGGCIKH